MHTLAKDVIAIGINFTRMQTKAMGQGLAALAVQGLQRSLDELKRMCRSVKGDQKSITQRLHKGPTMTLKSITDQSKILLDALNCD